MLLCRFKYTDFHRFPYETYWNIEEGYLKQSVNIYPNRALRTGAQDALFIVLQTKKQDVETDCAMFETGYRVSL